MNFKELGNALGSFMGVEMSFKQTCTMSMVSIMVALDVRIGFPEELVLRRKFTFIKGFLSGVIDVTSMKKMPVNAPFHLDPVMWGLLLLLLRNSRHR